MHITRNMYRASHEGYYHTSLEPLSETPHQIPPPLHRRGYLSLSLYPLNFLAVISVSRRIGYRSDVSGAQYFEITSYNFIPNASLLFIQEYKDAIHRKFKFCPCVTMQSRMYFFFIVYLAVRTCVRMRHLITEMMRTASTSIHYVGWNGCGPRFYMKQHPSASKYKLNSREILRPSSTILRITRMPYDTNTGRTYMFEQRILRTFCNDSF